MKSNFLQSPEWENIQKKLGRKTWRINDCLIIEYHLPLGFKYLYTPRPDILDEEYFFSSAAGIAKKEGHIFLKIDPLRPVSYKNATLSHALQPQKTIVCDLTKSASELLSATHEKTRYNIRLAERKGISVRRGEKQEVPFFWKLLKETAGRDGFHTHEENYYKILLNESSEYFSNELFFAEFEGKILAVALINFYKTAEGSAATYLHGASSSEHRNLMAPHLLHWRVMEEAKTRGSASYDFWGIDDTRWPGVTRFKRGFGGGEIEYPSSFDIVYRKSYYTMYSFIRSYRKSI